MRARLKQLNARVYYGADVSSVRYSDSQLVFGYRTRVTQRMMISGDRATSLGKRRTIVGSIRCIVDTYHDHTSCLLY